MKRVTYEYVGSTNDAARDLMRENPGERLLVMAREQLAGRGRLGRTWLSPRGGVWMTIVWPDEAGAAPIDETVSLIAGYSVWRGIAAVCFGSVESAREAGLRIKWPNDVLLAGRKVAGVLCERSLRGVEGPTTSGQVPANGACEGAAESRDVERGGLLIGIGVNADFDADELPEEQLRLASTTLRTALGRRVDADALAEVIADDFQREMGCRGGGVLSTSLVAEIDALLAYRGEPVSFVSGGERRTGVAAGIDGWGRLMIESGRGREACTSGEVDGVRSVAAVGAFVEADGKGTVEDGLGTRVLTQGGERSGEAT